METRTYDAYYILIHVSRLFLIYQFRVVGSLHELSQPLYINQIANDFIDGGLPEMVWSATQCLLHVPVVLGTYLATTEHWT